MSGRFTMSCCGATMRTSISARPQASASETQTIPILTKAARNLAATVAEARA